MKAFGTSAVLGILAAAFSIASAFAGTYATLYSFTGGSDGSTPFGTVIQDAAGNMYGQTDFGGAVNCTSRYGAFGCGTLYKFSVARGLQTLVAFTGPNGANGISTPVLVGNTLYSTTSAGGATDNGVIFSVRTDGTAYKLLHQFSGTDGEQPCGSLVVGPGSILYGVTCYGGPNYPHATYGVLFDLKPNGVFDVLHIFTNGADGAMPNAILASPLGVIVGSTFGGASKAPVCGYTGCGVVYAYTPATTKFTVLHTFTGGSDGLEPALGSLGPDNTIYGSSGAFFSITAPAKFAILPATGPGPGSGNNVGPVLGPIGTLTDTTLQGPYTEVGSLYQLVSGVRVILHEFGGVNDGGQPRSAPTITPAGAIIGTTSAYGLNPTCQCGTIYQYTP